MYVEHRTVYSNFRLLRLERRLTQRRMAFATGRSPSSISKFEHGSWSPQWGEKLDFLQSAARELDVDVERLLEGLRDESRDYWTSASSIEFSRRCSERWKADELRRERERRLPWRVWLRVRSAALSAARGLWHWVRNLKRSGLNGTATCSGAQQVPGNGLCGS